MHGRFFSLFCDRHHLDTAAWQGQLMYCTCMSFSYNIMKRLSQDESQKRITPESLDSKAAASGHCFSKTADKFVLLQRTPSIMTTHRGTTHRGSTGPDGKVPSLCPLPHPFLRVSDDSQPSILVPFNAGANLGSVRWPVSRHKLSKQLSSHLSVLLLVPCLARLLPACQPAPCACGPPAECGKAPVITAPIPADIAKPIKPLSVVVPGENGLGPSRLQALAPLKRPLLLKQKHNQSGDPIPHILSAPPPAV